MSIPDIFSGFSTATATDATATDAGISVDSIFNGILTVYGFFRQIIDFLKGIFKPIFQELLKTASDKIDEAV